MEKNYLIKIEYDGSDFSGWQIQPGVRTVQGVLEDALSTFCGISIKINGTSRTDAGVHALGQCATFSGDFAIPPENLMKAANNYLAGGMNALNRVGDVRIISIKEVPMDFHARFCCKGKTYKYIIDNSENADVFSRKYKYHIIDKLNLEEMKKAAKKVCGTHDFKSFEASGSNPRETTVRTVSDIEIRRNENDVIIEVTGDGFLYNMVRIIVGTLVEVGLGKRMADSVEDIIEARDRTKAGHTAPAEGLYLKGIYF